jgi:hypothetical protein
MANNQNNQSKAYRVLRTETVTFFDRSGRPVNGYRIDVEFMEFNEIHTFDVSTLRTDFIKEMAEAFIKDRRALSEL